MVLQPLPGRTRAGDERILLARVGFLRALYPDPRVAAFFADTDRTTGLLAAADRFAPLATALATRIGLRHRSQLLLDPQANVGHAIDAIDVTPEYETLVTETLRARDAAYVAHTQFDAPIVAAQLEVFVRSLGLPWRWLALELAEQYAALFWGQMYGRQVEQERTLLAGLGPGTSLQPQPGEDVSATYQRALATFEIATKRYLTAQRRSKQAGPKFDGRHLERYAEAFYRLRVKEPPDSIRHVARDRQTTPSNVKRWIATVEPLLDVPGERFPRGK